MSMSDRERREWAVRVASQPRSQLIDSIESLRRERDEARSQVAHWRSIAELQSGRIDAIKEFARHLADNNERLPANSNSEKT